MKGTQWLIMSIFLWYLLSCTIFLWYMLSYFYRHAPSLRGAGETAHTVAQRWIWAVSHVAISCYVIHVKLTKGTYILNLSGLCGILIFIFISFHFLFNRNQPKCRCILGILWIPMWKEWLKWTVWDLCGICTALIIHLIILNQESHLAVNTLIWNLTTRILGWDELISERDLSLMPHPHLTKDNDLNGWMCHTHEKQIKPWCFLK